MKTFYIQYSVGQVKYLMNFHDGVKKHSDGSAFFDVKPFSNQKKLLAFAKDLRTKGYTPRINHTTQLQELLQRLSDRVRALTAAQDDLDNQCQIQLEKALDSLNSAVKITLTNQKKRGKVFLSDEQIDTAIADAKINLAG